MQDSAADPISLSSDMLPSGGGPISSISISKTSALSKQKPSVSFFCLQCLLASMRNAKSVLGFKPPVWLSPLLPWHPAKTIMSLARNDSARQGQYTSSRQGYCAFQDVKAMKAKAGFGKDMQRGEMFLDVCVCVCFLLFVFFGRDAGQCGSKIYRKILMYTINSDSCLLFFSFWCSCLDQDSIWGTSFTM